MDINWANVFDWMMLLRCFVTGGIICIIGQILIDKTKLTSARILVIFVTAGAILGGVGIYQYLVDFAGAGATVPLTGFGYNLAKGAIEAVKETGLIGAFTGGVKAAAGGIAAAVFFRIFGRSYFKAENEKTIKKETLFLGYFLVAFFYLCFFCNFSNFCKSFWVAYCNFC